RVRGCTGMRLCLSTCRGRETGLLPVARLLGLWGWAVLARLPGLLRLFGLGRGRGGAGLRMCLSTCRGRETGLLPVARLLGLWGWAVLARLPGLLRLFGLGRRGLGARRMILLWSGGRVPLGILRGGRVRRVLTHAFPWLRCFG